MATESFSKYPLSISEWCIGFLKGRNVNVKLKEIFELYLQHHKDTIITTIEGFKQSLDLFGQYFIFEDFNYDYVTFVDDELNDSILIEIAKDVLRKHQNRYTLSVLLRKMKDVAGSEGIKIDIDEEKLKTILQERNCFTIEARSFVICKLSDDGKNTNIEPIILRTAKTEPGKAKKKDDLGTKKLQKERSVDEKTASKGWLREAIKNQEKAKAQTDKVQRKARKLENKLKWRKEREARERIRKTNKAIEDYHITDKTHLQALLYYKLISKAEINFFSSLDLYSVGDVYIWVKKNGSDKNEKILSDYRWKQLLKVAAFVDPELIWLQYPSDVNTSDNDVK